MGLARTISFIMRHPLNENSKVSSLLRFLRWQLAGRLAPGPVIINFVNETKMVISPGRTGATMNFYTGLQEFADMAFVLHALKKSELFVDVGANIGSYTILAAGVVGARCVSLEPIPLAFARLAENVRLNDLQSIVELYQVAAGGEEGEVTLTSNLDAVNHVVKSSEQQLGRVTARVETLDHMLVGQTPSMVKIDVEGYETRVIDGSAKVLQSQNVLAVIMETAGLGARYGFDEGDLHSRMLGYGFRPFKYWPRERRLSELSDIVPGGNTIWIRDRAEIERRISCAPFFTIGGRVRL